MIIGDYSATKTQSHEEWIRSVNIQQLGYRCIKKYRKNNKAGLAVSLETADPAKFPDEIKKLLGIKPKIPKSMLGLETKKEHFEVIGKDYKGFKNIFLK